MSVLLLDFETTGLDSKSDRIIEVGAMVVSDDFKEIISSMNFLVNDRDYPRLTPEITKVTGITQEMLEGEDVILPPLAMSFMSRLIATATPTEVKATVAYNMPFDKGFLVAEIERQLLTMTPQFNFLMQLPFICAMRDVEQNLKCTSWKLMHVALDHGVTVNPKELHRAINDVELMRKMLVEVGTDIDTLIAYKNEPSVYVIAKVQPPWKDGGESTGVAKKLGFSWQVAKGDESARVVEGRWVRLMKQKDYVQFKETAPIQVEAI